MKYTICGVSQEMAISLDLDVNDILILNWLHDFFTVSKKKNIDGHIFGWIKYEYLCDEMLICEACTDGRIDTSED